MTEPLAQSHRFPGSARRHFAELQQRVGQMYRGSTVSDETCFQNFVCGLKKSNPSLFCIALCRILQRCLHSALIRTTLAILSKRRLSRGVIGCVMDFKNVLIKL